MQKLLNAKTTLFLSNFQSLKGKFSWQTLLQKRLAALLYAAENREIAPGAILESQGLLRKQTKWFSVFRGYAGMCLATQLSLHPKGETQLANTLAAYSAMRAQRFWSTDFLAVAAYQIAAAENPENFEESARRARAFYDGMKARHRFLTGQNDVIFAVLLGLSDIAPAEGLDRMERLYAALRQHYFPLDAVQSLSHVLTLGGKDEDFTVNVVDLTDAFRRKGLRFGREYTLSSIGVLALLEKDANDLAEHVIHTYKTLQAAKGFGAWTISRQELFLLSAALVSLSFFEEDKALPQTALATGLLNILTAQQIAFAVTAASASAVAASST